MIQGAEMMAKMVFADDGAKTTQSPHMVNGVYQGAMYTHQQYIEAKMAKNGNEVYWLRELYKAYGFDYDAVMEKKQHGRER